MKNNFSERRLQQLDKLIRNLRYTNAFWGEEGPEKEEQALRIKNKAFDILSKCHYYSRQCNNNDTYGDMLLTAHN